MAENRVVKRDDLIYPELCYQTVGVLFEVYNELGFGYLEKYYQNAIAESFKLIHLPFREQVPFEIKFKGKPVGKFFLDFVVDNKIVLEIKKTKYFSKKHIEQVYQYLRVSGLKLGIIANFTPNGVKFKRIVNVN